MLRMAVSTEYRRVTYGRMDTLRQQHSPLILTTTETGGRTTFNVSKILRTRNDIMTLSLSMQQHARAAYVYMSIFGMHVWESVKRGSVLLWPFRF